jgi:hypothetical protein
MWEIAVQGHEPLQDDEGQQRNPPDPGVKSNELSKQLASPRAAE